MVTVNYTKQGELLSQFASTPLWNHWVDRVVGVTGWILSDCRQEEMATDVVND
jgi:hypothetical protein